MPQNSQLLDYDRIRFLHLLFRGYLRFKEIYEDYQKDQSLPRWREVEFLCQSGFSELREKAHSIFRRVPPSEERAELHDYEMLCDLVIGVCYHEALKLQENLYLVKLYRPRYEELKAHMEDGDVAEYFQIGEGLIREAEARIPINLKSIHQLLLEALNLLKKILSGHANNRVILRFLTRNLDLLEKVYGKKSLEDLLKIMYPDGKADALWRAVCDLVKSAHYRQALDCASKLAVILKKGSFPGSFTRAEVAQVLNKIHKEGKSLRDNDLVSRSHNLLRQFQDNPIST
jgi:hypothetical protein